MATVNKVDLSLDDIIKLNKKETAKQKRGGGGGTSGRGQGTRGRGRKVNVRGRGRGRGAASSRQQGTPGGGGGDKPGGLTTRKWNTRSKGAQAQKPTVPKIRATTQRKAQQLRQRARKTLQDKRRNLNTNKTTPRQQQQQQQVTTTPQQQRGRGRGSRGRGRGRGVAGVVRGRGRGIKKVTQQTTATGGGNFTQLTRPGGALKLVRALKTQRGRGGVARGRGSRGGRGQLGVGVARRAMQQALTTEKQSQHGQQRGRGRRGRGRGRLSDGGGQEVGGVQLTVMSPEVDFEPMGVNLSPGFTSSAEHHTSKSLDTRFTPRSDQKKVQRLVQKGGRSVQFLS